METVSLDIKDAIAIDGGAGTGKSYLGMKLAHHYQLRFLDTGVIYRVAGYLALKNRIAPEHGEKISELLRALTINVELAGENFDMYQIVHVDGEDISHLLFDEPTSQMTSLVARNPEVRAAASFQYRTLITKERTVVVGRDIGTNVLPFAKMKAFIVVDPKVVALRRLRQRNKDRITVEQIQKILLERERGEVYDDNTRNILDSYDSLVEDIIRRDQRDAHVLTPAKDAVMIDNNGDHLETLQILYSLYENSFND